MSIFDPNSPGHDGALIVAKGKFTRFGVRLPVYLESIYNDTNIFCKIMAPPAVQPVDKRWPDVEVVIKVGY
ncbi:MAG: DNA integrity scanning protein DisA nucleotide-binding domain protein [Deltaproteobacteria bacterium]|nr:DNA integrity scanning protein DisA nucleotide-binding domain protein [Deltaproteobacteria bacterium]